MVDDDGDKEAPLLPGDAKPSLYTFKEFSASASDCADTYCAPTGTNFKNIHCVGLNCYNCVWDQSIPPLFSVNPGEICTIECLDASGGQIDPHTSVSEDLAKNFDISKLNPSHGPIYVNGASVGDTLEVEIVKLQTGTWGWTGIIPNFGLLSGDGDLDDADLRDTPFLQIWKLDGENGYTEMFEGDPSKPCIRVPIHPFTGEIGVAPRNPGPHSQIPPGDHGGNVDCKHLVEGSKVYFPVGVEGALFSVGDGHAAQGEGEVGGTAIECPMKVDVRFRILKDKRVEQMEYLTPGPLDKYTNTGQWYFTTGIAPDLMIATKLAIKRMLTHIQLEYGLTKHEAMVLCSVAVDLKIHEVVDTPNWTVGAGLPLSIFHERKTNVCIIGGTGCAGTPTVEAFLQGGFDVTILSRGGDADGHFGRPANDGQNEAKQKRMLALKERGVKFVACNRMTERKKFRTILAESKFHVIVDFWAMDPDHVQDVINGTKGTNLQSYVFVSTNMVYRGGPEAFDVRVGADGPWLKEFDIDVVEYARSCPDSYGGRKVFCEAILKKAYEGTGFPYTALRMPSVIGPQADWRWSKLQEWVASGNPIDPHGGVGNKFRIVYSGDVGKACFLIATNSAKTAGEAINFCQDETPTYVEFLECLTTCLGVSPKAAVENTKTITEESPFSNYEGQWILDTIKAQELLGWKTTPMKEWMQETVDWHVKNAYFSGGDLPVADKAIR